MTDMYRLRNAVALFCVFLCLAAAAAVVVTFAWIGLDALAYSYSLSDTAFANSIALALVIDGAIYFPRQWFLLPTNHGSETYLLAFLYTLLVLNVLITILLIGGILFTAFGVVSLWWVFWQMLWLPSVAMVFRAFPVLTVIALAWSLVGARWHMYPLHSLALVAALACTVVLNIGLCLRFENMPL